MIKIETFNSWLQVDEKIAEELKKEADFVRECVTQTLKHYSESEHSDSDKADASKHLFQLIENLRLVLHLKIRESRTDYEAFILKSKIKNSEDAHVEVYKELDIKKSNPEEFDILNIEFNLLGLTIKELRKLAFDFLCSIAPENIPKEAIQVYVNEAAQGYLINPYHNFTHGFSVMQVYHYLYATSKDLQALISPERHFVGCVSSLTHDIGHGKFS